MMLWFLGYFVLIFCLLCRIVKLEKKLDEIHNKCEYVQELLMCPDLIDRDERGEYLRNMYKAMHYIERRSDPQ